MDEEIRFVTFEDIDSIVCILEELAYEEGHSLSNTDLIGELVRESVDSREHTIYVADRGEIIGFVVVHWIPFPMLGGREGYVSDLVIRAAERGTGVGSQLIAAVEARARELGCVRLMLNNRTTSLSYLRDFYPKHGFRQRDDFANFVKIFQ